MSVTIDTFFPARVTTIIERNAMPLVEGLKCFVSDTNSDYIYTSGSWVLTVGIINPTTQTALDGKAASLGADDNYATDAEKVKLGNLSGTNSGDNAVNTLYSGLVSNATHTGDATGATALSVVKIQGKDFPTLGAGDDQKYPKYVSASNAFVMTAIAGGGDMVLADVQIVTGAKTFNDTKFLLRNVANTFNGSFVNTNTSDRIYTLKDAAGTIAFTSDITGTNSGTNTGDQTLPVKATGAEINTGTDDTKFATPLAIADSNIAFLTDIPAAVTDATIVTTDITTNNATTAKHGWMPKGTGSTSTFFRSDMTQAAPTASVAITEAEIDVGTTPVQEASISVTDTGVTTSSKIIGGVAYKAPTGKDLDELEMDALEVKFEPLAGTINVKIKGLEGYIADKFLVWYTFA